MTAALASLRWLGRAVVCSARGSAPRPPVRGMSSRASATISAAAVCLAGAASAQTPPPASANAPEVEEIVITGSRIASPNASSASPIQVVTNKEILATGKNDITDILDQVPIFLVDRIEVLTGGASSVYGSDAIAGVVNFILKNNFQGLQFDTQFGEDWHKQKSSFMTNAAIQAGLTPLSGNVQD